MYTGHTHWRRNLNGSPWNRAQQRIDCTYSSTATVRRRDSIELNSIGSTTRFVSTRAATILEQWVCHPRTGITNPFLRLLCTICDYVISFEQSFQIPRRLKRPRPLTLYFPTGGTWKDSISVEYPKQLVKAIDKLDTLQLEKTSHPVWWRCRSREADKSQ